MPRVNLGRGPTKERQEATRRIIRRGMAEQGFDRQEEMVKLCKALKLTQEDCSAILGIK